MHLTRRGLIGAALALPLLTGCFAGGSQSSGASSTGSASGDDARLRVALAVPPAKALSPYSNDATALSKLSVVEGLTSLAADGTPAPGLATAWRRADDRTWTFDLRRASFQDGSAVTAQSVVGALRAAGEATPAPRVLNGITLTPTAVDADTVRITTSAPDPVLPLRLASPALGIFAPSAYATPGTVNPVGTGTGPFRLTRLTGQTRATLDRFDGYWGGRARAAGIDVTWIADGAARTNALRSGSVDVAEWIPTSQAGLLDAASRHVVPSVRTDSLLLNTASGPLTDPALRATVREAVDTGALAEGVFEGNADPAQGLFGPAIGWAAQHRVAVTGRPAGRTPEQVRAATGGRAVRLAAYTNRAELPEVASVVQQQLEKAGFTVRQDVREYTQMEADLLAGRYDVLVFSRVTLLDTGDAVAYLASDFVSGASYNIPGLADPAVDAAIKAAAAHSDVEARRDAVMAAEAAVLRTDAVVPLVHEKVVQGISPRVRDLVLDPRERSLVGLTTRVEPQ